MLAKISRQLLCRPSRHSMMGPLVKKYLEKDKKLFFMDWQKGIFGKKGLWDMFEMYGVGRYLL